MADDQPQRAAGLRHRWWFILRVLVTGSRELTEYFTVAEALNSAWPPDVGTLTVVHGGARGADSLAARWCKTMRELGYDVIEEVHEADWVKHGKAAGIIRNQKMVSLGADVCLAFPRGKSRGTRDCIARAENYMIPVVYG